jgi:hypothetical protein
MYTAQKMMQIKIGYSHNRGGGSNDGDGRGIVEREEERKLQ